MCIDYIYIYEVDPQNINNIIMRAYMFHNHEHQYIMGNQYNHMHFGQLNIDLEDNICLVETNLPSPIFQGLCSFTGG